MSETLTAARSECYSYNRSNRERKLPYEDSNYMKDGRQARYFNFLHSLADRFRLHRHKYLSACLAETSGAMVFVIMGIGTEVQLGVERQSSYLTLALGWGMAVTMSTFLGATKAYGMLNPALTIGHALVGRIAWKRVPGYILCQIIGAFLGTFVVYGAYFAAIKEFVNKYDDGQFRMNSTGIMFVSNGQYGSLVGLFDQIVSTAILAACTLSICDNNNFQMPTYMNNIFVGLLMFTIVGGFNLNAMAALNPARDLGPRMAIAALGRCYM